MKNYAIILAGGIGTRMGLEIPKQFLTIDGKPIIAYSIENFQKNKNIEGIIVVCVKEWIDTLKGIIDKYSLTKVRWVIEGGTCSHDSIRNGIFFLKEKIENDDYVIIHDAVRPILPQKAIDEVICVAHKKGNASSSVICHSPIVYTEDMVSSTQDIDREHVILTQAPQAFVFSLALECYLMAERDNKHDFTYTSSLLIYYGHRVFFAKGTTNNVKLTKKEDLALIESLLKLPEEALFD